MNIGPLNLREKGVVAINNNTTPEVKGSHLDQWITRVQEKLAYRSKSGKAFHKLRNLFVTKRAIDVALMNVLSNEGAKTAGVDGVTKGDLKTKGSRSKLRDVIYQELKDKSYRPSPVRRVYIPKANGKKRPLGIPTIKDRTVQALLKLILEPIYEPHFHAHSYGFRPYRSTVHAALRIKELAKVRIGCDWIVEGDIKACFDEIDHDVLTKILKERIKDGFVIRLIRDQLKSGILEKDQFLITEIGTPQGGIVSPLLANIFLDKLDQFIRSKFEAISHSRRQRIQNGEYVGRGQLGKVQTELLSLGWKEPKTAAVMAEKADSKVATVTKIGRGLCNKGLMHRETVPAGRRPAYVYQTTNKGKSAYLEARNNVRRAQEIIPVYIVRYADDFVAMTKTRENAIKIKEEIKEYLEDVLKLRLSEEKTLITHVEKGIKFLGFLIQKHPEYRKGAVLISPHPDKVIEFKRKVKAFSKSAWKTDRDAGDVQRLNQIITGWANYYRTVSSKSVFGRIDHYIWHRIFKDTYKMKARSSRKRLSRRGHYKDNYLKYAVDIKPSNRRFKGCNYGRWADEAKTCAHIIERMKFFPISYMHLHPQLCPYKDRKTLEDNKQLRWLINQARITLPTYNHDYGAEWLDVRLEAVRRSNGKCARCGRKLKTVRYASEGLIGHHITPLKEYSKPEEANHLENVMPVCPKCHAIVEKGLI